MAWIQSLKRHPKALWILSLIELCERFAFWGVGNLLVIYLLESYQVSHETASRTYAIFTGAATFLPLFGGWLADRWNYQSPLLFGALANAIGCFLLATGAPSILFLALFLIACGYGLFTPSLVAVLNHAYQDHEHLREGGFSIYYASINVGVFLAMLVMGATAGLFGWQMAFAVAGCVQTIGLAPLLFYFRRHKELFETLRSQQRASRLANKRLEPIERDRIKVIVAFCLVSIIFWMAYNQSFSSMAIFAHDYMNKTVFGIDIPEGIFFSSQSFFLILLAPILAGLYARLQKAHRDPSPPIKTALSLVAIAICFAIMVIATWSILPHATSAHTSWAYLVTAYFFMALGEMLLAPIGLAKISRLAPRRHTALSISAWYLCIGIAFFSGGMLASYMDKMATLSKFFGFFTVITLIAGGVMALLTKKLNRLSHIHPQPTDDLPHVER